MTSKRIAPLLLAASVFLTGATGAFLGVMTPAHAITSVDELSDVNRNHWAFEALRDLVEKYDVIEGYPDGTFRGNRMPTRWEMAAALNALIRSVGQDLARLGAEKANKSDLQTLARLQEEFRQELNALNSRVTALEGRAAAIEAKNEEQDNRLTLLEKTQLHGDFSFGILSDISSGGIGGRNNSGPNSTSPQGDDGILDGISAIGRMRLSLNIPVKEDTDADSHLGRGDVYARMVAAFGRFSPSGSNSGNGAFEPFSGYSRIAGDGSFFNEGILTGGQGRLPIVTDDGDVFGNVLAGGGAAGGNTRQNLYLETAYYKQNIKSGVPLLTDWMGLVPEEDDWKTTGDLYLGVVPWRFLYDKSPYRGNELDQFQNTSLVNTPGIQLNYNMPMLAYQMHQGLGKSANLDLTVGVGSIDTGDVMDGFNLTYEARLNYIPTFLGDGAMPGSLYAGGFHAWSMGNTLTDAVNPGEDNSLAGSLTMRNGGTALQRHNDGMNTFYAGWNQEWYEGIGTTLNYMLSDRSYLGSLYASLNQGTGANAAYQRVGMIINPRQTLSGVLHVPMKALAPGWRDNDVLGLGYALLDFHEGPRGNSGGDPDPNDRSDFTQFGDALEHVFEVYYKYQFTESISVVPSFQLIMNRMGLDRNDATMVFGFRTNYSF